MIFEDDGYDRVLKAARTLANDAGKRLGKILIDEPLLQECHSYAEFSCNFHGNSGPANHIKQIGHLTFWILKLRPFSFSSTLSKQLAQVLKLDKHLSLIEADYQEQKTRANRFYINEHLSIVIADHLINKGFKDIRDQLSGHGPEKAKLEALLKANKARVERTAGDMALSFREHNYSSRGMAMMLHLAYSTGYET